MVDGNAVWNVVVALTSYKSSLHNRTPNSQLFRDPRWPALVGGHVYTPEQAY